MESIDPDRSGASWELPPFSHYNLIGIPHRSDEDDEYKGYRIPKDSVVIANLWAILYNEEVFPDPERFNPGRFLKDGKIDTSILDPRKVAFGLGRRYVNILLLFLCAHLSLRICPGRFMGIETVWFAVASILTTLTVSKAEDQFGCQIEPQALFDEDSAVRLANYPTIPRNSYA